MLLHTKAPGPRPLLVSFNSLAVLSTVVIARRPKQVLVFREEKVYINDNMTATNVELHRKARHLVKNDEAAAT